MFEKGVLAIARMVRLDGSDPKIGVLAPRVWPDIDLMLWAQVHISTVGHRTLEAHMVLCRCPSRTMSDITRSLR